MRVLRVATLVLVSTAVSQAASAQGGSDEALKSVCLAETKAFFNRDLAAWQSTWVQDAQVTRTVAGNPGVTADTGWEKVSARVANELKQNPTPIALNVSIENFVARKAGDLAWVEYDQVLTATADPSQKSQSREKRLLVNAGNAWKIASQVTIGSGSLEATLNNAGYQLLKEGKNQEAIDLFKTNVRLFPESWNTYDSLGEAYAAAGQKEFAIQNYEKSLQLNPKNESGKVALEKLRSK